MFVGYRTEHFLALPLYSVLILLANHITKSSSKVTTQEEPQAW